MPTNEVISIPEGLDVDLDAFLSGEGEIDEDDIFAKDFDTVLDDMRTYDPKGIAWNPSTPVLPSLVVEGYALRHVEAGVLLFCPSGHMVGGYLSCDVSVDTAHQGRGLGTELVIERCLKDGMNPVLHLDTASYSSAGLAAHMSAWRRVRSQPDETAVRVCRLAETSL